MQHQECAVVRPEIILFDFGGVLAEEGFAAGLKAIARRFAIAPDDFLDQVTELIYQYGFVEGRATEKEFWDLVRERTQITGSDRQLTAEILDRFILRPEMMAAVYRLQNSGVRVAILSDQTEWLDRLEQKYRFFAQFETVFNSYYLGITKRDPRIFSRVLNDLQVEAGRALFVDDNAGHIARAAAQGLQTHFFRSAGEFVAELEARMMI
ncbi:MAG: HAD family phosphatase [Proteobacteria bacterium]|nr:HAD family phosphatase [Pseudomonadota bacterium]MBU1715070.1 HAD family phosphatase [Pseudomonadota bacterium]